MNRIGRRVIILFFMVIGFWMVIFGKNVAFAEQLNHGVSDSLIALNDEINYRVNSLNSIYFWKPCSNSSSSLDGFGSSACGQKLTASGVMERLREAVEKFGGFAMKMQIEYGVPWEAIFFHLYGESSMGTTGIAKRIEDCGYYNAMGYIYSASSLYGLTESQMGDCRVYHGDNGALAAVFPSYEDMIASYYTDYARNGLYDSAFSNLDPKHYDLEGFLRDESNIYSAAGWDGRVPGYGAYKDVWYAIKDTVHDAAKKKGWPTSEELAKEKNIPIGGKHPVNGDIKKQINAKPHSLSACDGSSELTDDDSSDDNSSGDDNSDSNSDGDTDSDSNSDSGSDSDSGGSSGASGASFKIDPETPAERFWFFEQKWSSQTDATTTTKQKAVIDGTQIDKDFGSIPYIYADNYDIQYTPWPPKFTPNGGNSKRKYYWITLPDKAFVKNMGDKYIAFFEKRKEPVYFITYDVWACQHQPSAGYPKSNYCGNAEVNPDKVLLGEHSLGYMSEGGYDEVNQNLIPKLGKLTCLHRLTTFDKPWVSENGKCNGASCGTAKRNTDYPEHIQQTGHTCGPASMSMLATVAAGKEVSESDVISIVGGDSRAYAKTGGSGMTVLDKMVGDKYGFEVKNVSYSSFDEAEEKMKSYLDKGYMLHFSGAGSYPFTGGGHYIGVFGWTDEGSGKVMLADSNLGNKEASLHDVIQAGLHYDFSVIKGDGGETVPCVDDEDSGGQCSSGDDEGESKRGSGTCSEKVLNSVDKILDLAAKNGSTYSYGGIRDPAGFDSILNNNAAVNVDCTGFASLVMYDAFGVEQSFCTADIAGNSNYVEVPASEVQPGDIFAYNYGCTAHGGIVAEVKNGKVTKIAQTGASKGYANIGTYGKNNNLGYTEDPGGVNGNLRCVNGDATDMKFYRYKGCK